MILANMIIIIVACMFMAALVVIIMTLAEDIDTPHWPDRKRIEKKAKRGK